ncbi:gas vesicle protein GvpG [bacterium]|nr:gas vesicle protein GvpG [bacterium]
MLIIDDILLFPMRSILWIFRELHNSARQEMENEAESITAELSDLYMMLETERITEDEFDAREKQLLDRLEMIQERNTRIEDDEDPDPDKPEE